MYHQTLTVTADMLEDMNACTRMIKRLGHAQLLPAKISTDPEANLDLAIHLSENLSYDEMYDAVWWLYVRSGERVADHVQLTYGGWHINIGILAQVLSWWADRILVSSAR